MRSRLLSAAREAELFFPRELTGGTVSTSLLYKRVRQTLERAGIRRSLVGW